MGALLPYRMHTASLMLIQLPLSHNIPVLVKTENRNGPASKIGHGQKASVRRYCHMAWVCALCGKFLLDLHAALFIIGQLGEASAKHPLIFLHLIDGI